MPDKRVDVDIDGLVYTLKVPDTATEDDVYQWAEKQKNSPAHKQQAGRKLFNSLQTERYKKEFPTADAQTIQSAVADSRNMGADEVTRRANLRTNTNANVADRNSVDSPLSALRFGLKSINEVGNRAAMKGLTGRNYDEMQGSSYYGKLSTLAPQSLVGRGLKAVDDSAQQKGWAGAPARLVSGLLEPASVAQLAAGGLLGKGASLLSTSAPEVSTALGVGSRIANLANVGMQGGDFVGSLPFISSDPQRFLEGNLLNVVQAIPSVRARMSERANTQGMPAPTMRERMVGRYGAGETLRDTFLGPQARPSPYDTAEAGFKLDDGYKENITANLNGLIEAEKTRQMNAWLQSIDETSTLPKIEPSVGEVPAFNTSPVDLARARAEAEVSRFVNTEVVKPPSPKKLRAESAMVGYEPKPTPAMERLAVGRTKTEIPRPGVTVGETPTFNTDPSVMPRPNVLAQTLADLDANIARQKAEAEVNSIPADVKGLYPPLKPMKGKKVGNNVKVEDALPVEPTSLAPGMPKLPQMKGAIGPVDIGEPSVKGEGHVPPAPSKLGKFRTSETTPIQETFNPTHEWTLKSGEKVPVKIVSEQDGKATVETPDAGVLKNPVPVEALSPLSTPKPSVLKGLKTKVGEIEKSAQDRLKNRQRGLQSGIDPQDLADLLTIGTAKLARKGLDFAQWSTELVREYGEGVRPHLQTLWEGSNRAWRDLQDKYTGPYEAIGKAETEGYKAKGSLSVREIERKSNQTLRDIEARSAADYAKYNQPVSPAIQSSVKRGVSFNDVQDFFRNLAKELHPDVLRQKGVADTTTDTMFAKASATYQQAKTGEVKPADALEQLQTAKTDIKTRTARSKLASGPDFTGGKYDNGEPLLKLPPIIGNKKTTPRKTDTGKLLPVPVVEKYVPGSKKVPVEMIPIAEDSPKTSSRQGVELGDAGAFDRFRVESGLATPYSVSEPSVLGGQVINEGAYERAARNGNASQTDTTRAAMDIRQKGKMALQDRINVGEKFIESQNSLIQQEAKANKQTLRQVGGELVRRIEMKRNDPQRLAGASENMAKLVQAHDAFTEDFRKYIIDNPVTNDYKIKEVVRDGKKQYQVVDGKGEVYAMVDGKTEAARIKSDLAAKEKLPANFGITDTGYFPHQSEGRYILTEKDGSFVGRFKTQKAASVWAKEKGKGLSEYAPLRVEKQGEFFGNYISQRKNTGALMKREGTAKAYENEDYGGVMSKYVNRVTNAIEVTKIKRDVEPHLKTLEDNGLGGIAQHMREDIEALSGKSSRAEEVFSEWLQKNEDNWAVKFSRLDTEDPQYALRHAVSAVNSVQNLLKLAYLPKNFINNAVQPLSTMLPYVTTKDFARAYKLAVESYMSPGSDIAVWMREKGIGKDAVKNLELDSTLAGRAEGMYKGMLKNNFQTKGSELSAKVGYSYGYMKAHDWMTAVDEGKPPANLSPENIAKIKEMTPDQRNQVAHEMGMAWKEKVEYDSSTWNIPPALRGWLAKSLLQYKSFAIKNVEEGLNYARPRKGQTKAEFAGQMAKGFLGRAAISGSKGVIGGKAVASLVGYAVAKLFAGEDEEVQQKWAEQIYLGLGNQIQADMSNTFGLTDSFYGSTPVEQWTRYIVGPNVVAANDFVQAGRKLAGADAEDRGSVVANYLKSLTPASKALDAGQQALENVDSPTISDREGKQTEINKWENTLRILGYTPASYVKARSFKGAPTLADMLN